MYFCCLEALQIAGKLAGAGDSAAIRLMTVPGELRFEVSDTGEGFNASLPASSSGLQNMADRVGALGGAIRVESMPGHGHQGRRLRPGRIDAADGVRYVV